MEYLLDMFKVSQQSANIKWGASQCFSRVSVDLEMAEFR